MSFLLELLKRHLCREHRGSKGGQRIQNQSIANPRQLVKIKDRAFAKLRHVCQQRNRHLFGELLEFIE